jgi:hypothetical protein
VRGTLSPLEGPRAPEAAGFLADPDARLITLILIRCGLCASDACTLAFDCLLYDGQGAPYLRYVNHKMRREAARCPSQQ